MRALNEDGADQVALQRLVLMCLGGDQSDAATPPIGVGCPWPKGVAPPARTGWIRFLWWHLTARVSLREGDDGSLDGAVGNRAGGAQLAPDAQPRAARHARGQR